MFALGPFLSEFEHAGSEGEEVEALFETLFVETGDTVPCHSGFLSMAALVVVPATFFGLACLWIFFLGFGDPSTFFLFTVASFSSTCVSFIDDFFMTFFL